MKIQNKLNKVGYQKTCMRFLQRQLEIAVPQFEEVQKKPAGFF